MNLPSILALLLVISPSAWSQVTIPDTPVGRNFSAMLDALNSRDRDVIAKYAAQYGRGESPDDVMRTMDQLGRLTLVRIVKSDRLGLQFIVETANRLQLLGMLRVEDAEPARVVLSLPWTPIRAGATVIGYDIDAATRSHVIEAVADKLRRSYVLAQPAETMADALARHQRDGDYDDVTNGWVFANRLTEDLQKISNDKHLVVSFSPIADGPPVRSPYVDPRSTSQANCGFERSETLPGEIGYVKIDLFVDPNMCRPKALEVLTSLVGVKGLVFDLRDAVGGHAGMVTFILGQLFDESVQLSAIRSREPAAVQQLHVAEHVSGLSFAATPVYVLTSSKTFSAAEWFAYDLQALKRATVVGETTRGGAHTARPERIDARFGMNLPYAEAVNPITGGNWEGSGVQPNVPVPAADAISAALQLARQQASR